MIWAYRDMLTSSHLREHTVTKSIWPCGQSDSAAHPPRLRGFERTDRTPRVGADWANLGAFQLLHALSECLVAKALSRTRPAAQPNRWAVMIIGCTADTTLDWCISLVLIGTT